MSFTENAVARWAELQRLQASPGWKLTNANPWVLALFREAFTRTRPRIPLDEFHSLTGSFLQQLRLNGQSLREDWTSKNYADDWVARRFLARPPRRRPLRPATPSTFPRTLPWSSSTMTIWRLWRSSSAPT